jgi:hypothetical protein
MFAKEGDKDHAAVKFSRYLFPVPGKPDQLLKIP